VEKILLLTAANFRGDYPALLSSALMSATFQTETRGDNFIAGGYLPSRMPAHQAETLIGIAFPFPTN